MRKFFLLCLSLCLATVSLANSRAWIEAVVINVSETDVTSELRAPKNTMHYTIETVDTIYFADFAFKPGDRKDGSAPDIAVNEPTKIAVEGKHVFIMDGKGREVKLHIVKKTSNK
jgi:hypothetical protein